MKILVTGSSGLIGRTLVPALRRLNHEVVCFDNGSGPQNRNYLDILDCQSLTHAIEGCDGVVHLAAVSRVIWGYQDPKKCWQHNVFGMNNVINAVVNSAKKPWLLFASSREVYGQQEQFPVSEVRSPLQPKNIYALSKVEGERLVSQLNDQGFVTGVLRLSSVYGDRFDHKTRVVPAFTRAAVAGDDLYVEGNDNVCDFTHVSDVVAGFLQSIQMLSSGHSHFPIHLTSGVGTRLEDLAKLAIAKSPGSDSKIITVNQRHYDVAKFIGDPSRAYAEIGWKARVEIGDGLAQMIHAYQEELSLA